MYIPHAYKNENVAEIKDFLQKHGFAILVNETQGKPWATHIPLQLEKTENGEDVLVGHIAKANPQWKSFQQNDQVLAIFNGPHSYISSSWYKEEEVPTWNYIAVHIYGNIEILGEEAVLASLHRLVDYYERENPNPIDLHNLSPKTMRQIKGIVGFQIRIREIKAAYKLSQGRADDHPEIMHQLKKTSRHEAHAIAEEMQKKST